MRILPVYTRYNKSFNQINRNTGFERSKTIPFVKECHQYTGVASVDLAYASMFDNSIAKDLKLMKLI